MLFFLSLPGHFSCPATFPMSRILPFPGKMNNTCVSLPYHLRDILLWDIPSLGVGVRELRRERITLFSGDGALEAGDSSPAEEGHEPHAHKESTRQPWSRKPHRPRPICGFEMRARN